jgi:hypothetical protein
VPGNVTVLEGDALDLDWQRSAQLTAHSSLMVIGNIPYQITSPLIEKALEPPLPAVIVFLVQKEVADRVTAAPGIEGLRRPVGGSAVSGRPWASRPKSSSPARKRLGRAGRIRWCCARTGGSAAAVGAVFEALEEFNSGELDDRTVLVLNA